MQSLYRILYAFGVLFASMSVFYAAPAAAQATRTWVSGVGDDVNPCSRTAPCKTFAGAIGKTAIGGEINCLDPGGFGAVTITKSMTIDCTGSFGGALAGGNAITVNGPGVNVVLVSLRIHGAARSTHGIRFIQGASLTIQNSRIETFNAVSSAGISFAPSTTAELQVIDTLIVNNSQGIVVAPTGSGSANITLDRVTIANSTVEGLRVAPTSNLGTGIFLIAKDSAFTGNGGAGVALVAPLGTNFAVVKLKDSTVSSNATTGVLADGGLVRADIANSTISNNATGISAVNGSILLSYLDNVVDRNGAGGDCAFTGSVSKR